ncbi:hypothetical protein D3C86_2137810 [compost metagenome]
MAARCYQRSAFENRTAVSVELFYRKWRAFGWCHDGDGGNEHFAYFAGVPVFPKIHHSQYRPERAEGRVMDVRKRERAI